MISTASFSVDVHCMVALQMFVVVPQEEHAIHDVAGK